MDTQVKLGSHKMFICPNEVICVFSFDRAGTKYS